MRCHLQHVEHLLVRFPASSRSNFTIVAPPLLVGYPLQHKSPQWRSLGDQETLFANSTANISLRCIEERPEARYGIIRFHSTLSTYFFCVTFRELTLASPEVLVTPTQDVGKILTALHATKLAGSVDLVTAIQVAQLALKHRQNKNLRQRIIAFVGSPLDESVDEKNLVKLGKKLKKNNVALDVVSFGEHDLNEVRLKALVDAVQSGENRYSTSID
jgi:hypothetical protein